MSCINFFFQKLRKIFKISMFDLNIFTSIYKIIQLLNFFIPFFDTSCIFLPFLIKLHNNINFRCKLKRINSLFFSFLLFCHRSINQRILFHFFLLGFFTSNNSFILVSWSFHLIKQFLKFFDLYWFQLSLNLRFYHISYPLINSFIVVVCSFFYFRICVLSIFYHDLCI